MASSSTFPIIPITVNKDEDALLEYCKQLTWENSLVKDAKWCNRSWPQVAHFNNLVPHIFHYASPAIRNTYFSALEKYGDFAKYFKTYAPGRRTDIRDDWQTFETWGYELIKAHVYLEDERYSKGIFPEIHSTGPRDYLLVIYPPFFAAAFEVEQQLERKKQLEDNMKVTLMFTRSSSSAAATIAAAATAQNHVATSFYNHYDSVTSPASSITTTSTLPNTTYTTNSNNRRNSSQSNPYARSSISSTSSRDSFIPGTIAADKHEKLCLEIEHMYMDSIPPGHVEDDRKRLVDKIVNMLRRQFPRVKLRVAMFGSSATGLDFADSDLDLCILVPSQYFNMDVYNMFNKQRERNSYYNMFCLSGMLKRAGMINIEAIPRANVPICKFEDPRLQIKADINTHNDMGVENSKLIKEYTFLEPRVRPFLYAIKNFTKRRKINDSTASTLSSYTYVLMGLFYLMTCSPPVIPNLQKLEEDNIICEHLNCRSYMTEPKLSLYRGRPKLFDVSFHDCVTVQNVDDSGISDQLKLYHQTDKIINNTNTRHRTIWRCHNRQTVGDLLVGFFSYYGIVFDYSTTISIRAGTTIPKLSSWRKRHYIAVEDPFIKERNVAVSCSKEGFEHVLNEFRRAHRLLRTNVDLDTVCEPVPTPSISYDFDDYRSRYNASEMAEDATYPKTLSTKNNIEMNIPSTNSSSSHGKKEPVPEALPSSSKAETKFNTDTNTHDNGSEISKRFEAKINSFDVNATTWDEMIDMQKKEKQKHAVVYDARQQMDQTPQPEEEDLIDMESVEFSPLPLSQRRKKATPKSNKSTPIFLEDKQQQQATSIETNVKQQTAPSHEIDVKLNPKKKDDTEGKKSKKKLTSVDASSSPSTTNSSKPKEMHPPPNSIGYMEVIPTNSPSSEDPALSSAFFTGSRKTAKNKKTHKDEDRVIGILSTDDEQDEEESTEKKTTPTSSTNKDDGQSKSTIGAITTVVVKKATMKLVDMPDYVDKMDIIDALEAFGFEVITIRSEIVNRDEVGLFPMKEWLVRVTGGRNDDLPPRFELQDLVVVRSYETRRLVAYRGLHLDTIMEC